MQKLEKSLNISKSNIFKKSYENSGRLKKCYYIYEFRVKSCVKKIAYVFIKYTDTSWFGISFIFK